MSHHSDTLSRNTASGAEKQPIPLPTPYFFISPVIKIWYSSSISRSGNHIYRFIYKPVYIEMFFFFLPYCLMHCYTCKIS